MTASGKTWTMGNQLTFTGSGEIDNGMNVSLSFIIDQGDNGATSITTNIAAQHLTVTQLYLQMLGTLVFSGEGGFFCSKHYR